MQPVGQAYNQTRMQGPWEVLSRDLRGQALCSPPLLHSRVLVFPGEELLCVSGALASVATGQGVPPTAKLWWAAGLGPWDAWDCNKQNSWQASLPEHRTDVPGLSMKEASCLSWSSGPRGWLQLRRTSPLALAASGTEPLRSHKTVHIYMLSPLNYS